MLKKIKNFLIKKKSTRTLKPEDSKIALNPENLKNTYAFWNDDNEVNYTSKHSVQEVLNDVEKEEKDKNHFSGIGGCGCGGGCIGGCGGGCL